MPGVEPVGPDPGRYEDLGEIATGGMGEVRRVRDRVLDRVLAMKTIRWVMADRDDARQRFLREARLTARLHHPGIVAVHDLGELPDGRLWYTMPLVEGRTFGALMAELHAVSRGPRWGTTEGGWSLHRLLSAFESACQAVAYAHSQGVVHRDLKPDNLMVGAFGEVQVMDWGIARLGVGAEEVVEDGVGDASLTREGRVVGTLATMAPEQARGENDQLGPAVDVYALGAMLYEILAGRPLRLVGDGSRVPAVLRQAQQGAITPLDSVSRRVGPTPPSALVALVHRCLSVDPVDRPADAGVVARELGDWLDGSERSRRARAEVEEAERARPDVQRLRSRATELEAEAADLLASVPPHAPLDDKLGAWRLQDEARALRREAVVLETRWEQGVRAALNLDPELEEAHELLARRWWAELLEAEGARDADRAARAELLLAEHDTRGAWAARLRAGGRLSLHTDPPGAVVRLSRYEVVDRRLTAVPERVLGRTPLTEVRLPRGSYLLELSHPEHATVRYPVVIGRGERWEGVAPGAEGPRAVRLPRTEELGVDDRLVPAGWAWLGGDPEAIDPWPRRKVWLDAFVVRRHPVTVGEYRIFLDDLAARGRVDEALAAVPREAAGSLAAPVPLFQLDEDTGRFDFAGTSYPMNFADRCPVVLVDVAGAQAYAAWRADRDGLPWRLPHDDEWEKAARGVDGRLFPWGDAFDPALACMVASHAGPPALRPVEDFPDDVGPYGVCGMAGGVRDLCLSAYRRLPPEGPRGGQEGGDERFFMVRGGAWSVSSVDHCRLASRMVAQADSRWTSLGFRLVRSV